MSNSLNKISSSEILPQFEQLTEYLLIEDRNADEIRRRYDFLEICLQTIR